MIQKLAEIQRGLDDRITKEHNLSGLMLSERLLAFKTELHECANEWRRFKFWSSDPNPSDKLLEEYVDGLHFVLSIGNFLNMDIDLIFAPNDLYKQEVEYVHLLRQFHLIDWIASEYATGVELPLYSWESMVSEFLNLGIMLGFSLQEIEQAYLSKNKINHTRQDTGY